MELIVGFILVVLGIFAAALSRQLTDEFKAWTPWVIKHLVNHAVRRLAEEQRSRFAEEWLAHINELPGEIGKVIAALGFIFAAHRMSSRINVSKRASDILISILFVPYAAAMMLPIVILIKAGDGGPIFIERELTWRSSGHTFRGLLLRIEGIKSTRTRRVLQRLALHRLPIFINVLRGDTTWSGF
jgi:hypothetical protein